VRVAFVGCGFVADYYYATLARHPQLALAGVYDRDAERQRKFQAHYGVPTYPTLEALLADPSVELVVNLTNPRNHYEVSKAALLAGKHVYSEKPLGMSLGEAQELVALAAARGLRMSSAPCSLLGETAQTVWRALGEQRVGKVRLVYAEMDDGMVHKMPYRQWVSASGTPWPYKDEFEVGCTLEHAGYYLTWLTAFFGPARSVTAFSSCLVPDKAPGETLTPPDAADFSVACIRFASGVVARLTCGIVAPHDHSLRVIGDDGILYVDDCWFYRAPVYTKRYLRIRRKTFLSPLKERVKLVESSAGRNSPRTRGAQQMDFCRGVAELADAIKTGKPGRLSEAFSLHNTELALAIHNALENSATVTLATTFTPLPPPAR
jgi:predicted dehydrogenase